MHPHPEAGRTIVPQARKASPSLPPPAKVLRRIRGTGACSWKVRKTDAEILLPDFLLELP